MDKMKVAIIGIGRWGQILLKELEKQAEVKYECDSKAGLGSVFADPEVIAVFIATPTETHFDIAMRAVESGKHVFLEKPGTNKSADLARLVELTKAKRLKLAVGYEFPHHSAAKKLKELMSGEKIVSLRLEWQKWGTFKDNAVKHLLCHDISLMKFFGITSLTPTSHKKTAVISPTDIIETEFGDIKSIINRAAPIKQKTVTILTDDGGYIWSNNELFSIDKESQILQEIVIPETSAVTNEISDFLNAIKEDREPMINGQFALEIFEIMEKLQP